MNYGQYVHSLASLKPTGSKFAQSRGILCSINDFEGRIEFINNTISKNMVLLPTAVFSNAEKYNASAVDPTIDTFLSAANVGLNREAGAYLELTRNETELFSHPLHFMNYIRPELQRETLRDDFATQSTILVKNPRS